MEFFFHFLSSLSNTVIFIESLGIQFVKDFNDKILSLSMFLGVF